MLASQVCANVAHMSDTRPSTGPSRGPEAEPLAVVRPRTPWSEMTDDEADQLADEILDAMLRGKPRD